MKARMAAYAGFQLRDFFLSRAVTIVVGTSLIAWGYAATQGLTLSAFDSAGGIASREQLQAAFEFVLAGYAFIAGAVAAQSLIARDRSRGYDRVFFSRPLSPARYYTQGFVLSGLASVVVATLGAQLYAVGVHPVSLLGVAAYVGLAWLTIGGLAFLLSALTGFHVPILLATLGADLALDRYANGLRASGGNAVVDIAQYLLPPGHVVAALREPFARGVAVDPRVVAWPAAFGLACLVVAVIHLRRRPFRS